VIERAPTSPTTQQQRAAAAAARPAHRSSPPPPPAPSPADTRLAAVAESGFSASQLSPLEFNFRPMDGPDALANGFAAAASGGAGSDPSVGGGGRTLSRHGAGRSAPATSAAPGRTPSALPHIGQFFTLHPDSWRSAISRTEQIVPIVSVVERDSK